MSWLCIPNPRLLFALLLNNTTTRSYTDGSFVSGMAAVACGAWHSLALSRTGDVYGWGWNRSGQLGGGAHEQRAPSGPVTDGGGGDTATTLLPVPRLLRLRAQGEEEEDVEFEQVGAGVQYSAGLARNGCAYVWGALGLVAADGQGPGVVELPSPPSSELPSPPATLACGPYHLVVVGRSASAIERSDEKSK